MPRSYKKRLDPDGEFELLAQGMSALAATPLGPLLGLDDKALGTLGAASRDYAELVELPETIAEALAPLGWIAFDGAPVEEYREAARLAASDDPDGAENVLTATWNDGTRLRSALARRRNLYGGDEGADAIDHHRASLMLEALESHEAKRYASAIALVLTQIDGIVYDMTGKDAKSFFAARKKATHLQDEETMAGHPDGLSVLAGLFTKDRRTTTVKGQLIRHGIVHGRELAYGTLQNSTKAFVALLAVLEWAKPIAAKQNEQRKRAHEERYAGSDERDCYGRRMDRRGFDDVQSTLQRLEGWQIGHWKRRDRYATKLEELDPDGKYLTAKGLALRAHPEKEAYLAWAPTPPGIIFGIAGRKGETIPWRYVGKTPPPLDLGAPEWRHDLQDDPYEDW